jgi:hypothetical protein
MGRVKNTLAFFIIAGFTLTALTVAASNQSDSDDVRSFSDISSPPPGIVPMQSETGEIRPSQPLTITDVFTTGTYVTAPGDFPIFKVERDTTGYGDGYLFIATFRFSPNNPAQPFQLILDNDGQPIYYKRGTVSFDFKVQPNGNITYFDSTEGVRRYIEIDDQYQVVNTHAAGNGYATDNHDLQLLDNDNWLILADDGRLVDMSVIVPGGDPNATVVGCVIQEIDNAGNVLFEWNSFDHIPITDSYADLTAGLIRYVHCNAIEPDFDGNLLMSARNLQEITKINRQTGDIIWRLGGRQNDFIFTNDSGFVYQHDVRRLPNGLLTIFDNRTDVNPNYSRAVDYIVDQQNFTATLVREYRNTPDTYGPFMGNYSYLPNSNRLIGWGLSSQPILTEVDDNDSIIYQLNAVDSIGSYRAFRFPWKGYPIWSPLLIARQEASDIELYFSWNGATEVVEYFVFGSAGMNPVDLLAIVPRDGFETTYTFTPPTNEIYSFQVEARGLGANSLAVSNVAYVGAYTIYLPMTQNN